MICLLIGMFCQYSQGAWYDDQVNKGHKGWYGYEKYQEPEEEKEKETPEQIKETKNIQWPTIEEFKNMYPKEMGEWFDKASEEAIKTPSEENILRWSNYRRVILEKSTEFASAVQVVALKHPETMTPSAGIKFSGPGKKAVLQARRKEIDNYLLNEKENYALILFISEKAPLSEPAVKVAQSFAQQYGWQLKIFDANQSKTLAEAMGVKIVPTAVLLGKGMGFVPVMVGWSSLSDLKQNVFKFAKILKGEADITDFGKPLVPGMVTIP